jgi:hypothetical protein
MYTLSPTDPTPDNCPTFSRGMFTALFRYQFPYSGLFSETVTRSEIGYTELRIYRYDHGQGTVRVSPPTPISKLSIKNRLTFS